MEEMNTVEREETIEEDSREKKDIDLGGIIDLNKESLLPDRISPLSKQELKNRVNGMKPHELKYLCQQIPSEILVEAVIDRADEIPSDTVIEILKNRVDKFESQLAEISKVLKR